ncbi:MAG: pyridoxamine 5'-phosphate oxidase family protein [Thermoplasmata archaeon]|nr:pyridoxamine 5'-phosphate oxidase family protein [Thermoplasmata archaeon]
MTQARVRLRISLAARRVVDEQRLGFVATVGPGAVPNLSPKGTLSVWDDRHLIFADLDSPGTVRNLQHHPRFEVNVVDPILRKGWRFRGTGRVYRRGRLFEAGVRFFEGRKLSDAPRRVRSIVLLTVDYVAPLISPAYAAGRTEEELRRHWWKYFRELERRRHQPT